MFTFYVLSVVSTLFWPFLLCHFATVATERINDIGYTAYDCNWFDLPMDFRKCMILIILRSEETIQFTGLNLCSCTLETFGKVWISINCICLLFWWVFFCRFSKHPPPTIWCSENWPNYNAKKTMMILFKIIFFQSHPLSFVLWKFSIVSLLLDGIEIHFLWEKNVNRMHFGIDSGFSILIPVLR